MQNEKPNADTTIPAPSSEHRDTSDRFKSHRQNAAMLAKLNIACGYCHRFLRSPM